MRPFRTLASSCIFKSSGLHVVSHHPTLLHCDTLIFIHVFLVMLVLISDSVWVAKWAWSHVFNCLSHCLGSFFLNCRTYTCHVLLLLKVFPSEEAGEFKIIGEFIVQYFGPGPAFVRSRGVWVQAEDGLMDRRFLLTFLFCSVSWIFFWEVCWKKGKESQIEEWIQGHSLSEYKHLLEG